VRKCLALVAAGVLALGVTAPVGARSDAETLWINGPGALALWTTSPETADQLVVGESYIETVIFVYDQQNAPPKFGWFKGALFAQWQYHVAADGTLVDDWSSFADAPSDDVAFRQPMKWASGSVTDLPVTTCDADECWDDGTVSFDITFTGVGPIDRMPAHPEIIVTPGVSVQLYTTQRVDTFIREVQVEDYTLEGKSIPEGARYVTDPFWRTPQGQHGSRIFWVHVGGATVCHDGVVEWGECVPS
jgi:hypothetical protein